jgi:hypothetical protein
MFDETRRVGGIDFDPAGDWRAQAAQIADQLRRKIADKRS